ncbi:hypothetical protein MKQ68_07995 [Chitinophaga horti]|uniref:Uncharacterized protein n=1 Tax=Chitinophaga horti TaxID=2920382 RepID=A0ABY6JA38_9BACT|nr:hypothetical protein [Chitinophaga horti]UYQ95034.1 hypothetical protein MKQ68_07995 [Chitinophaga horti]
MDPFMLTITHKGSEQQFEVQPSLVGYTAHFYVNIDGIRVTFEPDEENSLRVIVPPEYKNPDVPLLQKIAAGIESWL